MFVARLVATEPERPNIVFILAGDQGWADIGYQSPDVKTPNILTDDHPFDAMAFARHVFRGTPHMDSIARNSVHLPNASFTTPWLKPNS